jgi:hypothetical protein
MMPGKIVLSRDEVRQAFLNKGAISVIAVDKKHKEKPHPE